MSTQQVYCPTGFRSYYYQLCTLDGTLERNYAILSAPSEDDSDYIDFEEIPAVSVAWDENRIVTWFKTDKPDYKAIPSKAIRVLNLAGIIVPERFIQENRKPSKKSTPNDGYGTLLLMVMVLVTIASLSYFQVANFDKSNPFLVTVFFAPCLAFWSFKIIQ